MTSFVGGRAATVMMLAAIGYIAAAQLAALWEVAGIQPLWLATGVIAGLVIIAPVSLRTPIVGAGIAAHSFNCFVIEGLTGNTLVGEIVAISFKLAFATLIIRPAIGGPYAGRRISRTIVAIGAAFAIAALGAAIEVAWHQPADLFVSFRNRTFADALGIVALGSLPVLRQSRWLRAAEPQDRIPELAGSLVLLVGVTIGALSSSTNTAYLPIAVTLWLAVRFGPRLAVPAATFVVVAACSITATEQGQFWSNGEPSVLQLQLFCTVVLVSAWITSRYARDIDEQRHQTSALIASVPDHVSIVNDAGVLVGRMGPGSSSDVSVLDMASRRRITEATKRLIEESVSEGGGTSTTVSLQHPFKDELLHLEIRSQPMDNGLFLVITRNITDQLRLFQQVEQAEQRASAVASHAFEGYVEIDANYVITFASDRWHEMIGAAPGSLVGTLFSELFDPSDWPNHIRFSERIVAGHTLRFEQPYLTKQGDTRWALVSADPELDESGNFVRAGAFALDTTERHLADEALAEAKQAMSAAEATERERLAQALHDGALQEFVAANLLVGSLKRHDSIAAEVGKIEQLLTGAIDHLRSDVIEIIPDEVGEGGLGSALQQLVERSRVPSSPVVSVVETGVNSLTGPRSVAAFQIGREALVNAIVHSEATEVRVSIEARPDGTELIVADNGVGFEYPVVANRPGHLGLRSIAERSNNADGWYTIDSQPGSGTRMIAWIPKEDGVASGSN